MPDSDSPRKYANADLKLDTDLSPSSKTNLQDALIDEKPDSQLPPKHQSIVFNAEADLAPKSKSRLQEALTEENAWGDDPKDCVANEAWVDRNVKELYEAFAKDRRGETSTCGYSKSSDRCSAKEGTAQDLRYILMHLFEKYGPLVMMHKGHDALGRHWVSGWKLVKATPEHPFYLAVVMCVEEEEEANTESRVLAASILANKKQAEDDANWVLVNKENGK